MIAIVLVISAVAAGCGGGDDGGTEEDLDAGATPTTLSGTTVPVPSTAGGTTVPATTLTLKMTDVRVVSSEEPDSGMRVLLPAGVASASVTVTGLPSPNRVISVCQANELDRRMSGAACRTPANGEAVNVTLGSAATGVEIAQVGSSGSGPEGNITALSEVTIRYAASSREVNLRLQEIAGGDTTNQPTISLTPPSASGNYRATLNWKIIPVFGGTDSRGQLELVQGGNVVKMAESANTQVSLSGTLPPPVGEAAVRIRNVGAAAMVTPELSALLP